MGNYDSFQDVQYAFYDKQLGRLVDSQRFMLGSTGTLEITVAGNFRALLTNDTGAPLKVLAIRGMTTATGFMDVYLNPTTGLPTADKTIVNAALGAPTKGNFKADADTVTALSGGLYIAQAGFGANQRTPIDLPGFIVQNGHSVGMNLNFGGAAKGSFSVMWIVA